MLRDITIGQYYPTDSIIHKLDPRVKLVSTLFFIISLFFVNQFWGYIIPLLFLGTIIKLSKVPFKFIVKGLKAIVMLLVFMSLFHLFLTSGEVLVKFWIFKITKEGIFQALFLNIRLIALIMGSSIMTLTTTPNDLTDGLESIMKPFGKIGLPIHEIAMTMSIALRFIPILLEETNKIMKAQTARGADFESGNIIQKAKSMVPILVPLFVSAFRRADELAMAMESRCYHGSEGRTKMKPLKYKRFDVISYLISICFLGIVIGTRFLQK